MLSSGFVLRKKERPELVMNQHLLVIIIVCTPKVQHILIILICMNIFLFHGYIFYFFAHVLTFLLKSKEKKHHKKNERNLETEQMVPEVKGEIGYVK